MGQLRVAVVTRYGLSPAPWRVRHALGEVADETPYAYHLAASEFSLSWSRDHRESRLGRGWRLAVRGVLGFDLVHVWRNRDLLSSADAVWTHTEREHLAVAALKALAPRRYRARSVAQSVWLWDVWPTLSRPRRLILGRLLRHHDVEVVLSRVNRAFSSAEVPGRTVLRIPFGTHPAVAPPPGSTPGRTRVLVIGNDRHRDWPLMRAVSVRLPQFAFDIISLSDEVRGLDWPANVRVRSVDQREILTAVYAEATIVALPLRPNRHASGCTVAIEAISAGLPVVASDAGGIDEYLEGAAAALVAPGDVDGFVQALVHAAGRRSDPALVHDHGLTAADYVLRLAALTRSVIADAPVAPTVDSFTRVLPRTVDATAAAVPA